MSKISRIYQKLFGSTGATTDFGQFGSLAASAPVNTKDPATIQGLPAFLTGWASAVTTGNTPTLEETNSLFLLAFTQIAYILQTGIAEYDASTTYYSGSYCQVSGVIYVSLQDSNTGNTPSSSPSYWQQSVSVPVGTVQDFAGPAANIPGGYLSCDGSAISRISYASLYSVIGTTWGLGDGVTTFNLPDLRGMTTVGYKSTDSDMNAVGKTLGEKSHVLTTPEMPAHTHSINGTSTSGAVGGYYDTKSFVGAPDYPATGSTGGNVAHNNMQPSAVVLKIIKY